MKIWINGISGKMGQKLKNYIEASSIFELSGGSDKDTSDSELLNGINSSEGVIDFSSREGNQWLFNHLIENKVVSKTILIASTGLTNDEVHAWNNYANHHDLTLMIAPNTSFGILNLYRTILNLTHQMIEQGFDAELIETHHKHKIDSPSGTALFLAKALEKAHANLKIVENRGLEPRKPFEIGMHVIRGGGVFGEHEIRFISEEEELYIGHRALSRDLFAKGALSLFSWLKNQEPGVHEYDEAASSY